MTFAPARARVSNSTRVLAAIGRNAALRQVMLAFLLFNAVEFGTWVALLLYAYGTLGPASIGLVALAQLVPAGVAAPFLASFADRFDRRRALATTYAAQAVALGIAGTGMLVGASVVVVILFAAAAATAIAVTRPSQGALLPSISRTPTELTAANGVAGTVEGLGLLGGPLGAAAILAIGAPGHVVVLGAVLCAAAALLVARAHRPSTNGPEVRPPESSRSSGSSGSSDEPSDEAPTEDGVLAGLQMIRRLPGTRLLIALLALRMVTSGGMDVVFVLLALDVFRTGDSGAALLSAALGAGTVIGGAATFVLVGRQHLAPAMAISAGALGAGLLIVGATDSAALAPVLIAGAGIGYAAVDVIGRIVLQRATPDPVLARVLGALEGIGLLGLALGSVLVPVLASALGPREAIAVVAVLLPAGVAIAWRGLRRIDRESKVPVRTLRLLQATPIFAPLAGPQLEWVAHRARWITAEPGDAVIREGDVGDAYYVLEHGRMRISRSGSGEQRVATNFGDGFGEIALMYGVRRTATVAALQSSVLLEIDRVDFLEILTGQEHARRVAEHVAHERRV